MSGFILASTEEDAETLFERVEQALADLAAEDSTLDSSTSQKARPVSQPDGDSAESLARQILTSAGVDVPGPLSSGAAVARPTASGSIPAYSKVGMATDEDWFAANPTRNFRLISYAVDGRLGITARTGLDPRYPRGRQAGSAMVARAVQKGIALADTDACAAALLKLGSY